VADPVESFIVEYGRRFSDRDVEGVTDLSYTNHF
jgi:hypothetical protein